MSAELVAEQSSTYDAVQVAGQAVYWLEGRPTHAGGSVLMRWEAGGTATEVTPAGLTVGTRVHEYGGGAYQATEHGVVLSRAEDDRLWWLPPDRSLRPLTPPAPGGGTRYADLRLTPDKRLLVCVRERHHDRVVNELVALPVAGTGAPWVLAGGQDFYAAPRPSPDGRRLAWLTWDAARMPWDGTWLWVAELDSSGRLGATHLVAGGAEEAIVQPEWAPDGSLWFVSDRSGWWNLYRVYAPDGAAEAMCPLEAEFAEAPWELDYATYAFTGDGRVVCRYRRAGTDHLGVLDPVSKTLSPLAVPFTEIKPYVRASGSRVVLIGATPTTRPAVATLHQPSGQVEVLAGGQQPLDPASVATPRQVTFPSAGATAHALYYPPTNPKAAGPPGQRPPLIVQPHPGPTAAAKPRLELRTQYFTSRGFAVVDVDYAGSTGYGRDYRQRLAGQWGVADVADCVAAAHHLIQAGLADPDRVVISGASAGGFTALTAMATTDVFAAGTSLFGITDLDSYRQQAPKFQRPMLHRLLGPYPQTAQRHRARSPVHLAGRIRRPVLLLHGSQDPVVPPAQAEAMAGALREAEVACTYRRLEGEGHGFKQPANIRAALEAELEFYQQVLRLPVA